MGFLIKPPKIPFLFAEAASFQTSLSSDIGLAALGQILMRKLNERSVF